MSRIFRVVLCLLAAITLSGMAAGQKQVVIRIGTSTAPDHHVSQMMINFKKAVEVNSQGAIRVDVFPANQLGGIREQLESVRMGNQEIMVATPGWISSFVPQIAVLSMPYLFKDQNAVYRILDGSIGRKISDLCEKAGFTILGYPEGGFRHITNNVRSITKIDDFKGLKIRMQADQVQMATMTLLGANPVAMDWSEVYSALQQGVIDGQDNWITSIYTGKLNEVQKYLSLTGIFYDPMVAVGNARFFARLSSKQKSIVKDAIAEAIKIQREMAAKQEEEALAYLRGKMTVNTPSESVLKELRAKTLPIYEQFKPKFGASLVDSLIKAANS